MTPKVLAYETPSGLTFWCIHCREWHRHGRGAGHRWAPTCAGREPDACVRCGRPVYGNPPTRRRRVVACSARCRRRHTEVQYKERHRP